MRFSSLLSTALLGASVLLGARASPLESAVEEAELMEEQLLEKRATTTAITGVTGDGIVARMELRTMQQKHPDMFNIYLLGLQRMQSVAQSNPLSYYQIAGIHGRPYIPWDGVGTAPGYGGGYCTHTSNLFLPWHRPYLALYEQQLYQNILAVVAQYPAGATRQKYATAAAGWRLPYWDWAEPTPPNGRPYPLLVSQSTYLVTSPTGQQTIPNPLYQYTFKPISATDMVYNPFASWNVTMRYPTSWDVGAQSQNSLIIPIIANNQISFRDRLYNLFTSYSNFSQFGNEAWITSSTPNADSLESLHDAIHSITGSNGHMTYLDYSAFDPIFFLHHAMIDRCFALWQALYPNSYVQPMSALAATFNFPAGTVETATSPLYPFHKDTKGTLYTSNTVKNVTSFGYTYPELVSGKQSDVKAAINALYGNTAGSSTVSSKSKSKRETIDNVGAAAGVQDAVDNNSDNSTQYICNIVSQKFAMNGSYAIYVFIGDVTNDTSQWATSENLVGTHAVFASLTPASQAQAQAMGMNQDLKVSGAIPLTTMLVNKVASGSLASLDTATVEPYLTANLDWRVAMMDGTEIPVSDVPDLSVSVVTAQVQPATSPDAFPKWGAYKNLVNITAARPAGYNKHHWSADEGTYAPYNGSNSSAPYPTGTGVAPGATGGATALPSGSATYTAPVGPKSSTAVFTGAAEKVGAGLLSLTVGVFVALLL